MHRVICKIRERNNQEGIPVEITAIWKEIVKTDDIEIGMTKSEIKAKIDSLEFPRATGSETNDALDYYKEFNHLLLRASMGTLFDLRYHTNFKKDENGWKCKECKTLGIQKHFLNDCPTFKENRNQLYAKNRTFFHSLKNHELHNVIINIRDIEVLHEADYRVIIEFRKALNLFIESSFDKFNNMYPKEQQL